MNNFKVIQIVRYVWNISCSFKHYHSFEKFPTPLHWILYFIHRGKYLCSYQILSMKYESFHRHARLLCTSTLLSIRSTASWLTDWLPLIREVIDPPHYSTTNNPDKTHKHVFTACILQLTVRTLPRLIKPQCNKLETQIWVIIQQHEEKSCIQLYKLNCKVPKFLLHAHL